MKPSPEGTTHNIYILLCSDGTLYTGSTNNIQKRLHAHNHTKQGAKYTRGRRPVELIYKEEFSRMKEALQREAAIKKMSRKDKLLLSGHKP